MAAPRYLEKFVNDDLSLTYTFPLNMYECEVTQGLRSPLMAVSGASYPYRMRGSNPSLKDAGKARVRFLVAQSTSALVDTETDSIRAKLYRMGRGKLYSLGADGTRRWAYAELAEMPSVTIGPKSLLVVPVSLGFNILGDAFGTTQYSQEFTLDSDPELFTITNAGDAEVYDAIMTIRGTYTNPELTNTSTGYSWSSTRDGTSADHRLKVDAGRFSVEYSSDGGSVYADDVTLFTRGANQVQYMRLNPGDNEMSYADGGTPNAVIAVSFYPAYHSL